MGLDYVELIMGVESTFKIEIRDEEASRLDTVGKLYGCILNKLEFNSSRRCLSSAAFYGSRRAFMDLFGAPRENVAPAVLVDSLLPRTNRKACWLLLGKRMGVSLPPLERPGWLGKLILLVIVAWWLLVPAVAPMNSAIVALGYFLGGVSFTCAVVWLTQPYATNIPHDCTTVRDLIRSALRLNYGAYMQSSQLWNPDEVWETLRAIIVEELSVKPEQVTPQAHFVRDLNVG